jgi:metallo-beta-lactamase family protein
VKAQGRRVLFSGDLGRPNDAMMDPPPGAPDADVVLVESTYGNRRHPTESSADQLAEAIRRVISRRGIVLIPTFAVGRAQLLLHMLVDLKAAGKIPNVPVYLNSPMATKVNGVFAHYPKSTRLSSKEMNHALSQSIAIESAEESIALNSRTQPMIILAASGMMTGGRVLHHLKAFAGDPKNAIVFSGFQVPGTRGHQILGGEKEIKIHGDYVTVRAETISIEGLSAHGDQNDLINWLKPIAEAHPNNKPRLFYVHGDLEAAEGLRRAVQKNLMWAGRVPDPFEEIDL